jgi:hypothetical protein
MPTAGLKLRSSKREIAVRGVASPEWATRLALRQGAALASPPEPPSFTRAEGPGVRAISVENFNAGAGPWIKIVQRFEGCASFWVGTHCPCHRCLLWRLIDKASAQTAPWRRQIGAWRQPCLRTASPNAASRNAKIDPPPAWTGRGPLARANLCRKYLGPQKRTLTEGKSHGLGVVMRPSLDHPGRDRSSAARQCVIDDDCARSHRWPRPHRGERFSLLECRHQSRRWLGRVRPQSSR